MSVKYYPVDEDAARRAEEINGFADYVPGSAAAMYHRYVDQAVEIAERQKRHVGPEHHERIDYLLDLYARKLAENMNDSFAIDASAPSTSAADPAAFPCQKETQNYAYEKNMAERQAIQHLLDKIRRTGMGIIAVAPDAIPKLEQELAEHVKLQEYMKSANAYFRRHGTLEGCPNLSPEKIRELTEDSVRLPDTPPYLSFQLTSNDARIGYLRERIQELTRWHNSDYTGWEFEGGVVEVNREENWLEVLFGSKPNGLLRSELKRSGFRWSPKAGAWQRQLNDDAIRAADSIKAIWPVSGEKPSELQRSVKNAS
ncbi:MAG: hypothetical protein HDT20_05375 [Oscillibacter sp.]|nr:hypothetical protein [Oscillibacter sp.]